MREDQARVLEEEAMMAAEWIQAQRETAAELVLYAAQARARAREAIARAQRVRESAREGRRSQIGGGEKERRSPAG